MEGQVLQDSDGEKEQEGCSHPSEGPPKGLWTPHPCSPVSENRTGSRSGRPLAIAHLVARSLDALTKRSSGPAWRDHHPGRAVEGKETLAAAELTRSSKQPADWQSDLIRPLQNDFQEPARTDSQPSVQFTKPDAN